jgi:hypothetical protein
MYDDILESLQRYWKHVVSNEFVYVTYRINLHEPIIRHIIKFVRYNIATNCSPFDELTKALILLLRATPAIVLLLGWIWYYKSIWKSIRSEGLNILNRWESNYLSYCVDYVICIIPKAKELMNYHLLVLQKYFKYILILW